jgi:periplasmic protein TonB
MGWSGSSLTERQEYAREPIRVPMAKSALLHVLAVLLLLGYAYAHHLFHGSEWGSNNFQEGAIQATLVNSAAVPLPQEHPPTENVLETTTPSEAPALQEPKAAPIPLPEAVPIPVKQVPVKHAEKPSPRTPLPRQQPPPKTQNKATYGEATPANLPKAPANAPNANIPVQVSGGDFGSRYGWYVNVIKTRVQQNWLLPEVATSTPAGATVYIQFSIRRDGSTDDISVATSSGYPSLDTSCLRAVQRVDTFGALPSGYDQSSLSVLYHCTYPGHQ